MIIYFIHCNLENLNKVLRSAGSASINTTQAEKQRMNANTGTTKGRPINKCRHDGRRIMPLTPPSRLPSGKQKRNQDNVTQQSSDSMTNMANRTTSCSAGRAARRNRVGVTSSPRSALRLTILGSELRKRVLVDHGDVCEVPRAAPAPARPDIREVGNESRPLHKIRATAGADRARSNVALDDICHLMPHSLMLCPCLGGRKTWLAVATLECRCNRVRMLTRNGTTIAIEDRCRKAALGKRRAPVTLILGHNPPVPLPLGRG